MPAQGEVMLQVVRDVYEGGRDLMRGWQLLAHATARFRTGGPEALKTYYELCLRLDDPRGQRVRATLAQHGRRTLESEHQRFLAAYRSEPTARE
jgi:hypothetical protein